MIFDGWLNRLERTEYPKNGRLWLNTSTEPSEELVIVLDLTILEVTDAEEAVPFSLEAF